MARFSRLSPKSALRLAAALACAALLPVAASGDTLTMNNGLQLEGKIGEIGKMGQNPLDSVTGGGANEVKQIVLVDDDLRRTFISARQVRPPGVVGGVRTEERITIDQRVLPASRRIGSIVGIIGVEPFDCYGRRTFTLSSNLGRVDVVQGITEITPRYTKVEALSDGRSGITWDMRIATSSIPRETLSCIIKNNIDTKNPDARLSIVRLYTQAERYRDAQLELAEVIKDFPELADLKREIQALARLGANRLIKEIELRQSAGQHGFAFQMAKRFPRDLGSSETLLRVGEFVKQYEALAAKGKRVHELFAEHLAALKDESLRESLKPVQDELKAELNFNTLDRMADYLRLSDDPKLLPDQKLALAISGWVLGNGEGTENLAVAKSLVQVRNLVQQYLSAERPHERDELLRRITEQEGSSPSYLVKIIANMTPPVKTDTPQAEEVPGLFLLKTPGLTGESDVSYYVQLPPEYDPHRRYPCVVTLNGAGTTPLQQLDWWAGSYEPRLGQRTGQAARQGYVVVAPLWTNEGQGSYEFTAREHAAVLYSLRDAMRRVSIDSDRVYLSGHSMGGDAAWDIGLAHPDTFAGVIPIVAKADRYIDLYTENAKFVPFYFVCGELDGDKLDHNALSFDRYLTRVGYDVTIVEYRGRGHEHFHDEILRLFDWMKLHKRDFFPREFSCVSRRPWDNFFWWAEMEGFPPKTMIVPAAWGSRSVSRVKPTEGKVLAENSLILNTGAEKATVWLSHEMVDFTKRVRINGRDRLVKPSAEVLLEDVRTRCDRQHPFSAKEPL